MDHLKYIFLVHLLLMSVIPIHHALSYSGENSSDSFIGSLETVRLYADWSEPTGLDSFWLSTNETGIWRNSSPRKAGRAIDDMTVLDWVQHSTADCSAVSLLESSDGYLRDGLELRYTFNNASGPDYVFVSKNLDPAIDMSAYARISYHVKADAAGRHQTRIVLHTGNSSCDVDYVPIDTASWENIEFNLSDFSSDCSLSSINMVRIAFNDADDSYAGDGSILLDELYLLDANPTAARADFIWRNTGLPKGTEVGWLIYANDSSGNLNNTGIGKFVVGESLLPSIDINSPQGMIANHTPKLDVILSEDRPFMSWYDIGEGTFTFERRGESDSPLLRRMQFSDDFESYRVEGDANPTWQQVSGGAFVTSWIKDFQENRVLLLNDAHHATAWSGGDYTVETRFYIAGLGDEDWHGVRLHFRDTLNWTQSYYLQANPNSERLRLTFRENRTKYADLAEKTGFPVALKEWHSLKVKAEGCAITSYFDGELITWDSNDSVIRDCSRMTGPVGLTAEGTGTSVYFDDVRVWVGEGELLPRTYPLIVFSMDSSNNTVNASTSFTIPGPDKAGDRESRSKEKLQLSHHREECPEDGLAIKVESAGSPVYDSEIRLLLIEPYGGLVATQRTDSKGEATLYPETGGTYKAKAVHPKHRSAEIVFDYSPCEGMPPEPGQIPIQEPLDEIEPMTSEDEQPPAGEPAEIAIRVPAEERVIESEVMGGTPIIGPDIEHEDANKEEKESGWCASPLILGAMLLLSSFSGGRA